MPAVTQRISTYLGGVSKQSDDKMLPGQVRECFNGFPDATYGMTKRPGFEHIANLGTGDTYDEARWFYINRDSDSEIYIGCITKAVSPATSSINIWNAVTGVACNVSYTGNAQDYLTGNKDNYKMITVQDTTIVINDSITVGTQTAPTGEGTGIGTVVLGSNGPEVKYYITIQGVEFTVTSDATDFTFDDILTDKTGANIKDAITDGIAAQKTASNADFDGTWTVTRNGTSSLDIQRQVGGVDTGFTLQARGGGANTGLTAFLDEIDSVGSLPTESFEGHKVKILNTNALEDTYYAVFKADDGVKGRGFWKETIGFNVSAGLNDATMPHELINTGVNTFIFKEISYENRLVGDEITNRHPSFVGEKITNAFFNNNRLGFLSADNVILSRSASFYDFYFETAQTSVDSDPIDISCSSIIPTSLYAVIPTAQGIILFSPRQQFILFSDSGVLTPASSTIRALANYEMDSTVLPADVGTNINFLSKTPGYTRVFSMVTKGQQENPQVLDLSRVVKEWIPPEIDQLISSPQNSMIALASQSSKEVFIFRYYNDGKENLMEAWTSWTMPGTVQFTGIDTDDMWLVTKQANQVVLSKAALSQSPEQSIIVNNEGERVNPCMDFYATASSVVFDSANHLTKCYLPYNDVPELTPVLIIKGNVGTGGFQESGYTISPQRGNDGNPYFLVPQRDLSSFASDVVVGFKYDFDVHIPTTYYRPDDKITDFTANLTIARMKFSVGLSGAVSFKLKTAGRAEWTTTIPVIEANTYLANDVPLDNENIFMVPIHQRTENFKLRIFNDSPFPSALNAMMWEGNYTPRFYRRR